MSRNDLIRFLRALLATLAGGLVIWLLGKLGIQVTAVNYPNH